MCVSDQETQIFSGIPDHSGFGWGEGGVSQGAGIMQSKYFLKAKDKVKRPKGSPTRSRGLAPRLLGSRLYIFHMLGV